jgi:hypothetical protein
VGTAHHVQVFLGEVHGSVRPSAVRGTTIIHTPLSIGDIADAPTAERIDQVHGWEVGLCRGECGQQVRAWIVGRVCIGEQ